MACPICREKMTLHFTARVLNKYEAGYELCDTCGFLRAQDPYWLDEAYSSAISATDTGLVMRNLSMARQLAGALYWVFGERGAGRFLDAAGGYGMLTRMMRDFGFDFYWADKYGENLLAPGFEYSKEKGDCQAVTAVEVMEHLFDPVAFIKETLDLSGATTLLFTTELYEGRPPRPDNWWYYAFATGQHIAFFQRSTLERLGSIFGLQFTSANGIHVLSKTTVNERKLDIATRPWVSRIAPWWIRRRLGSRTISDRQLMLGRINE